MDNDRRNLIEERAMGEAILYLVFVAMILWMLFLFGCGLSPDLLSHDRSRVGFWDQCIKMNAYGLSGVTAYGPVNLGRITYERNVGCAKNFTVDSFSVIPALAVWDRLPRGTLLSPQEFPPVQDIKKRTRETVTTLSIDPSRTYKLRFSPQPDSTILLEIDFDDDMPGVRIGR